ncbi:hypothetical protein QJQ45_019579 [Haematococcus lacustris]|nr:hypothetical protein QJQ45_019579 [Haematococcus lacustris]
MHQVGCSAQQAVQAPSQPCNPSRTPVTTLSRIDPRRSRRIRVNSQHVQSMRDLEPALAEPSFDACARPAAAALLRTQYSDLVQSWPTPAQLPLVYHKRYNISFFGIEKLHPFDSCKFQKVVAALEAAGCLQGGGKQLVQPLEASQAVLSDLHTPAYLNLLHTTNLKVVQVTELPPLLLLPPALVQWKVMAPMRLHVGGTMLATALAVERGWAINLGGGMHHAYYSNGMGWCPYDDITLAIRRVRAASQGKIQKVLYIDLDAHQGNGIGRDKLHFKDNDLFILDMYNGRVFPQDDTARPAIDIDVQLTSGVADVEYLKSLEGALSQATQRFPRPDLVFYNAGTDILEGDPLGRMKVTREGVLARDAMVWSYALKEARAPIVMTLSGGYARSSAAVVSESIVNLMRRFKLLEDPPGSGSESAGPGS